MKKNKEAELNQLKSDIWYQFPRGVTSIGPCPVCGKSSRGCNLCIDCLSEKLSDLVGVEMAKKYIDAIRNLRKIENDMEDIVIGN
jgi:hypothetical protein